jgi:Uma2 family endonuclease
MSSVTTDEGPYIADLLEGLGGISPRRVLLHPPPGQATEKDLLAYQRRTGRACELVDGTLVEKPMGFLESHVALELGRRLGNFVEEKNLGVLAGEHGTMRIIPKLVRAPDVSFVRWEKLPGRHLPREPIPDLVPDLAVEVLSESNTPGEMKRKLKEYFLAGTTLVWLVDPEKRTVTVHTAPDSSTVLTEADTLDGGDVLPGLSLPVRQVFAGLPPPAARPRRRKKR